MHIHGKGFEKGHKKAKFEVCGFPCKVKKSEFGQVECEVPKL